MHAALMSVRQKVVELFHSGLYITFSIWGATSLAEVENMAALQLFTLGGGGGGGGGVWWHAPP